MFSLYSSIYKEDEEEKERKLREKESDKNDEKIIVPFTFRISLDAAALSRLSRCLCFKNAINAKPANTNPLLNEFKMAANSDRLSPAFSFLNFPDAVAPSNSNFHNGGFVTTAATSVAISVDTAAANSVLFTLRAANAGATFKNKTAIAS